MSNYTKVPLSGRADGLVIQITVTTIGTAQTIHTVPSGTTTWDEIWLWVNNTGSTDAKVSILHGSDGTDATCACKDYLMPPKSQAELILAGAVLQNSLTVKAYCDTGLVNCFGYVKRPT